MTTSRIDIFKADARSRSGKHQHPVRTGKEYEKTGATEEMIETLNRHLAAADDQGNAYGMLARAYEKAGRTG